MRETFARFEQIKVRVKYTVASKTNAKSVGELIVTGPT